MLSIQEREIIEHALAMKIAYTASPRVALVNMISQQEFALTLSLVPTDPLALARVGIDMCIDAGWTYLPPWLQQVLRQLTQTPEIASILARIANQQPDWNVPPPSDLFEAMWLARPGLPFLNRKSFRQSLRRLSAPTGPSVLVVNGDEPKSGKSYSVELLDHVLRESAPPERRGARAPIALVKLQPGMGASLTPEVLARKIIEGINPSAPPLEQSAADEMEMTTPDRRNERLCHWIFNTADATGDQWWVVLDNLDDPDLPPMTRNFISKLAELVTAGKYSKKLRLVITKYPPDLVAGVNADMLEKEQLGPIGEVDLIAFFEHQFKQPDGSPPPPLAVEVAVQLTMMNLPQDQTRLEVINRTIQQFIEKLSRKDGDG